MDKSRQRARVVLIMGIVGIMGVLLTIASDFILIGRPSSSKAFFKLGTESMAGLSQWRITIGAFVGIAIIPFQIAGLISIYYGIKPAGKAKALAIVLTNAHTLMMAVAFHTSYAFIASGWNLYYEIGVGDKVAEKMIMRFAYYWKLIIIVMSVELVLSSAYYVILILSGKTLYPKWMAFFNPICILIYIYPLLIIAPKPIGGFIAPAFLNLTTLIFFILSTGTIYKKLIRV
ncbi:hypothetical protein NBE98_13855 [Clostridium swellfunianum]|uniref:DUF6796 family protein n=1 Tax=Clostridium swellfunianum TaxID=1367462 RepID=UPI00202DD0C6|nr:DUF6796 family protein [Clostridium swellfunianum]MCM0649446.1 hypothetical protein [Clostridium swellfunianum]